MAYYTNRPCQHAAADKNWRPSNCFPSSVTYADILVKICIIIENNNFFSRNKLNTSFEYVNLTRLKTILAAFKISKTFSYFFAKYTKFNLDF